MDAHRGGAVAAVPARRRAARRGEESIYSDCLFIEDDIMIFQLGEGLPDAVRSLFIADDIMSEESIYSG